MKDSILRLYLTKESSYMSLYKSYLEEIEERKAMGLHPKPIDDEVLATEIISNIKDISNEHRED